MTYFMPLLSFYIPWKHLWFSDVFGGYQKRRVTWNADFEHTSYIENENIHKLSCKHSFLGLTVYTKHSKDIHVNLGRVSTGPCSAQVKVNKERTSAFCSKKHFFYHEASNMHNYKKIFQCIFPISFFPFLFHFDFIRHLFLDQNSY